MKPSTLATALVLVGCLIVGGAVGWYASDQASGRTIDELRTDLAAGDEEMGAAVEARSELESEVQALEARMESMRDQLADASAAASRIDDLERQLRQARRWQRIGRNCVDAIIQAYNSSSFATEFTRAFTAAVLSSACQPYGYQLEGG
jgi:septal ring factor EnvC (AmiA/AmiB activator)